MKRINGSTNGLRMTWLAEIIKQTPDFFENLVVRLLEKWGMAER